MQLNGHFCSPRPAYDANVDMVWRPWGLGGTVRCCRLLSVSERRLGEVARRGSGDNLQPNMDMDMDMDMNMDIYLPAATHRIPDGRATVRGDISLYQLLV